MPRLLTETAAGVAQLERPEEVVCFLEVWSDRHDLVEEILHADDPTLAKGLLYDGVVREGNSLVLDLAIATLVDELTSCLYTRVTEREGEGEGEREKGREQVGERESK